MKKLLVLLLLFIPVLAFAGSTETVLNDCWTDSENSLLVRVTPGTSSIVVGQATIDVEATGTAVVLTADSIACKYVIMRALWDNTLNVIVGSSAMTTATGFVLTKDDVSIRLDVDNVQDIYFDADLEGEGVNWIAVQ